MLLLRFRVEKVGDVQGADKCFGSGDDPPARVVCCKQGLTRGHGLRMSVHLAWQEQKVSVSLLGCSWRRGALRMVSARAEGAEQGPAVMGSWKLVESLVKQGPAAPSAARGNRVLVLTPCRRLPAAGCGELFVFLQVHQGSVSPDGNCPCFGSELSMFRRG